MPWRRRRVRPRLEVVGANLDMTIEGRGARRFATGAAAWRDLASVVAVTVFAFLLAGIFELSEGIGGWLTPFERYQLDELPAAIIVLVAGLGCSPGDARATRPPRWGCVSRRSRR